jgi:hypothetical protein
MTKKWARSKHFVSNSARSLAVQGKEVTLASLPCVALTAAHYTLTVKQKR